MRWASVRITRAPTHSGSAVTKRPPRNDASAENVIGDNKTHFGRNMMRHLGSIMLAAALLGAGPALAQDKTVEWRFSHWVPPSHRMHPAPETWAADIEKASGGTIKIKIFPA